MGVGFSWSFPTSHGIKKVSYHRGRCKGLGIKQFFTIVSNRRRTVKRKSPTRTILQHLKSWLGSAKRAWVDELPSVLWAYRTTPRTATGDSQFNLYYGTEAVTPAEIGELSWRVKYYNTESNVQGLRMNLDFVEEARERAAVRVAMYKASMDKVYNARVKPISFQVGDLVMRKAEASGPIEKLNPKWEGPYKVVEIVNAGAQVAKVGWEEHPTHVEHRKPQEVLFLSLASRSFDLLSFVMLEV
ncbi:UNVERIFIED_CONTAM: hypothetical protein Slati_4594300 [Sesamum latifolium]|uniref:Reverse transcriptase domain-containing protein n=1 Tax=Sesamum latifolium TaxID=2727402 RepID=A0AAW2S249_9LAMI